MTLGNPKERDRYARVMALDWGARRIGIAVTDDLGLAAHGLPTLTRKNIQRDLDALAALIRERGVETLVVGNPLHMDGHESRSSRQAVRFARRLAKFADVDLELWDERLTSWEAEQMTKQSSINLGATDRLAAVLLLESYLAANRE